MTFKHTIPLFLGWDPTLVRRFKLCAIFYRRPFHQPSPTISCDFPPSSTSLFAPRLRSSLPRSCVSNNFRHQLFHLYTFEIGRRSLGHGCSVGWHLTVTSFLPYFFQRSGLWKLAVPPWETGSKSTARGSADGLPIRRSRVAA